MVDLRRESGALVVDYSLTLVADVLFTEPSLVVLVPSGMRAELPVNKRRSPLATVQMRNLYRALRSLFSFHAQVG